MLDNTRLLPVAALNSIAGCCLQVDLPVCNVTLLSTVNGTANCNNYIASSYFPAAGVTSVASLVLELRISGTTVATSAITTINLHAAPVHTSLAKVTMLVTVPYRNVHPGAVTLFYALHFSVSKPSVLAGTTAALVPLPACHACV